MVEPILIVSIEYQLIGLLAGGMAFCAFRGGFRRGAAKCELWRRADCQSVTQQINNLRYADGKPEKSQMRTLTVLSEKKHLAWPKKGVDWQSCSEPAICLCTF